MNRPTALQGPPMVLVSPALEGDAIYNNVTRLQPVTGDTCASGWKSCSSGM